MKSGITEKLDPGRIVRTYGRLDIRTLDHWALGPWTTGRLDPGRMVPERLNSRLLDPENSIHF